MLNKIKIVSGAVLCMLALSVYAEPGVALSESTIKSRVGGTHNVDILLSEFPVTEGGGLDLHFNPAIMQISSLIVDGETWDFVNQGGEIDNVNGTVTGLLFSSYQGVSGSAKIASLEIEFVGKGVDYIVLSESAGNPFASDGQVVAVKFDPTRIQVRGGK